MEAADNGKADIVSLLLAAGADVDVKDIVSKRISICLVHMCVCVCVCVCVLYSSIAVCMISEKCRFILFLYFMIVIRRI